MPSLQEGLPPQLLESLMNLEPLEILVAEREEIHLQSWYCNVFFVFSWVDLALVGYYLIYVDVFFFAEECLSEMLCQSMPKRMTLTVYIQK
jgi:hypothetical protein